MDNKQAELDKIRDEIVAKGIDTKLSHANDMLNQRGWYYLPRTCGCVK